MPQALTLESISSVIRSVVTEHGVNRLPTFGGGPIFDEPVIGVADGDDPLFEQFKQIIGPHHLTPREILRSACPAESAIEAVRVICWAMPYTAEIRHSNASMKDRPSRHWAHAYYYGIPVNDVLRRSVVDYVTQHGATAVSPGLSPLYGKIRGSNGLIASSTWSERHALFAAGMGAFGLCGPLITEAGAAVRCGTVIVNLPLPVTTRIFQTHNEACLYVTNGLCGRCMQRCPAGAIGPSGHDKDICQRQHNQVLARLEYEYGIPYIRCGLCITGVPCESGFPGGVLTASA